MLLWAIFEDDVGAVQSIRASPTSCEIDKAPGDSKGDSFESDILTRKKATDFFGFLNIIIKCWKRLNRGDSFVASECVNSDWPQSLRYKKRKKLFKITKKPLITYFRFRPKILYRENESKSSDRSGLFRNILIWFNFQRMAQYCQGLLFQNWFKSRRMLLSG